MTTTECVWIESHRHPNGWSAIRRPGRNGIRGNYCGCGKTCFPSRARDLETVMKTDGPAGTAAN
jgi:hypothetical protein